MSTDADHNSGLETEPALRGILALLVADRQEREGRGADRAESILAHAGLGHDQTDPRSIMNVVEGVGLRETQAFFIPAHAAAIEKVVGRWREPGAKR